MREGTPRPEERSRTVYPRNSCSSFAGYGIIFRLSYPWPFPQVHDVASKHMEIGCICELAKYGYFVKWGGGAANVCF